jgi:hypothetical protein
MPGIILLYYLKKGKITDPTAFYPAFYFAGGQGVLEMGKGTTWAWDIPHFGWGHHALEWGTRGTLAGDMGYSSN